MSAAAPCPVDRSAEPALDLGEPQRPPLVWSFRSPARSPLARFAAHVLIRLMVIGPWPAHLQASAALFPLSLLAPLVEAGESFPLSERPSPHASGRLGEAETERAGGVEPGARTPTGVSIDLSGNVLTVSRNGVTHSTGRAVTFVRDAAGRITSVVDPESHAITYGFDAVGDLVSVTDREQSTTRYGYHARFPHHLESIEDPLGRTPIRNEYFDDGRIRSHTDAFGFTINYAHDLAGRQELVTDRNGKLRVLEYDTRGNVVKETQPDGRIVRRTFDARNNRLTETEPHDPLAANPPTTTTTYDAASNVTSITDPLGNRSEHTYNARNQVLTTKDARGKTTTNVYDTKGNLTSTKDALNNVSAYTYDTQGNVKTQTVTVDGVAQVTAYEYDTQGNLTREIDAAGHATTYTYDTLGNRRTETKTRTTLAGTETLVTTNVYDKNSRLTQTTHPDGSITKTTYDVLGRQRETFDQLSRMTAYTFDEMGRQTVTTYPDGTTEGAAYDAEGRRTSTTNRRGKTTTFDYDDLGRLVKTTHPGGAFTTNTYDDAGRLVATKNERGHTTRYEYDAAGRRTKLIDAKLQETLFTYDPAGNLLTTKDPAGKITTHEYDDLSRRTRTIFHDGTFTTTAYDGLGRRISETTQEGRTTFFKYDELGHLVEVTDPDGKITRFAYDETSSKVSQTDANGRITRFEHDRIGREIRRILPSGAAETKTYDAAGNQETRTDFAGRTTSYGHEANNRLTSRSYPDGSSVTFTYTATGQRETMTDARGTTTYSYNDRGWLTSVAAPEGRIDFDHDEAGALTRAKASLPDGRVLAIVSGHDVLGRLQTVTDPQGRVATLDYDASGNRASLTKPNGVATSYTYDPLNRLTNITATHTVSARLIQSYALTLSPAGRRTRVEEGDGHVRAYDYDAVDRLVRETVTLNGLADYEKVFTYDAVGNRLTQTTTGTGAPGTPTAPGTIAYVYDERDQLTSETLDSSAVTSYTYDPNGNVITKSGEASYAWDFEYRLVRVTKTDGTVVEHAYDADGNKVRTKVTPATGPPLVTKYLLDPSGPLSHVLAETDESGSLKAFYVRADGELLSLMRPDASSPGGYLTRWYENDHVGSVRRLTDESGLVTDGWSYAAFGELIAHTGTDPQPAGEPLDPNSGFQHHRARWMDPSTARFLGMDPFEGLENDPLTLHRYLYAGVDPVNRRDPSGRDFTVAQVAAVGAIIGVLSASAVYQPRSAIDAVKVGLGGAVAGAALAVLLVYALPALLIGGGAVAAGTGPAGPQLIQGEIGSLPPVAGRIWLGHYGGSGFLFDGQVVPAVRAGLTYLQIMAQRFGGRVLSELPERGSTLWPAVRAEIEGAQQIVFNISYMYPGSFTEAEFRYIMSRPDLVQKTVFVTQVTFR